MTLSRALGGGGDWVGDGGGTDPGAVCAVLFTRPRSAPARLCGNQRDPCEFDDAEEPDGSLFLVWSLLITVRDLTGDCCRRCSCCCCSLSPFPFLLTGGTYCAPWLRMLNSLPSCCHWMVRLRGAESRWHRALWSTLHNKHRCAHA